LQNIFALSLLASLTGYHTQNFFGFAVVPITLLFYLIPAFFFIDSASTRESYIPLRFFKSNVATLFARVGIILIGTLLISGVGVMWLADFYYTKGISGSDQSKNYRELKLATTLRPDEPLYQANLGLTTMDIALHEEDEGEKQEKIKESFSYLNEATSTSPANLSLWRYSLQALFELASDKSEYKIQVVKTAKIMGDLAPTEAQIQYNLASMQLFAGDIKEAQRQLAKVVDLKFNYKEAWELLLEVDSQLDDKKSLNEHSHRFKEYFP
ncbi:hypothetical protein IH981_01710, partial [Patescibacteria group bacterium]|nr:hypothetical protein [Patescibacteria group bacterium]